MNNTYELVFDAHQVPIIWFAVPAVGALFLTIGVVWLITNRRFPNPRRRFVHRAMPYFFAVFSTLWLLVAIGTMVYRHHWITSRLDSGQYELVEGVVTDFRPMPYEGHQNESFVVNGHLYEYSDFVISPGFSNTQSHGGPIREGLRVRIADVDGLIARLEIAR